MQFNSFIFILLFLPLTVLAYFLGNKISQTVGKIVLIAAGVIFYGYYDWSLLIVLGISLLVNYGSAVMIRRAGKQSRLFIVLPVVVNIGLLLYFKYLNFFLASFGSLTGKEYALKDIILPLGISFITFQQIAYITAVYRKEQDKLSFVDYLAYILYFPKILMGPLTEPADFIRQLNDKALKKLDVGNLASGIKLFSFGLFKKVMLADVFAEAVSWGYANIDTATSLDWLLISLFYTFELYFDFSGYSDMAVGTSLMLNITLPINFDSPYKALSIRDFWRRWHISLTNFFTKYIYIPLGGSRKGRALTFVNIMIVFLISGFWHGAGWTFILWGILHGLFVAADRALEKVEAKVPALLRWLAAFVVIDVLTLLFRSESVSQWIRLLGKIVCMQSVSVSDGLIAAFVLPEATMLQYVLRLYYFVNNIRGFWMILYLLAGFGICLIPENNYKNRRNTSVLSMLFAAAAFVWGFLCLSSETAFIYFNF